MNRSARLLLPVIIVFMVINLLVLAGWKLLSANGVEQWLLLGANFLFLFLSLLVFVFQKKALNNPNPNVFIRSVMGGMMVKMLICAIAVIAYTLLSGEAFNKRSIFIALFLYLFYLGAEVKSLTMLNKQHHG
jgi:hypothetical protein